MQSGMSPYSLSLARFALGLPLLWLWHFRQSAGMTDNMTWTGLSLRIRGLILFTGLAMALNVTCWFAGIELIGATLPTVISICCAPVLVAIFSVLRGYEPRSGRLMAGLGLAVAGVALIVVTKELNLPANYALGLVWSFSSAILYAVVVLGNARMPKEVPAITVSAWSMTAAAVFMAIVSSVRGIDLPTARVVWLQVGYTGVVTTSVAYLAFAWGARHLPPTSAVVGTLVEPLAAAVLAAWIWNQPLTGQQYLGAALLAAAIWVLSAGANSS
jgi:DME family drug/metabolite transporter